tara:strand:- start:2455 stop:2907 length:453 start_codon:yes stop_codon:yes gene_type:complete
MEELLKKSSDLILHIETLPADFADINRLINAQSMLSTTSYHLSCLVSKERLMYEYYCFQRKYRTSKMVNDVLDSGKAKSISRAEYIAKEALYEVEVKERNSESSVSACKIILNQINVVLDGLAQRISYLKQEKSFSNFTSNEAMGNRMGG